MKPSTYLKSIPLHLCMIGILLIGLSFSANAKDNFRVVCIHSYAPDYVSYPYFNHQLEKEFKANGIKADIRTFYLDCDQYRELEEIERVYNYIDTIQNWKPDIILVNEDQATYSLLSGKHPFIFQVPIVFSGVNFPNWALLKHYTNVTGFWDKPDYNETCKMIEQIMGESKIRIFYDDTFLGRKVMSELMEQIGKKYPQYISTLNDSLLLYNDLSQNIHTQVKYTHFRSIERPDSSVLLMSNLKDNIGGQVLWTISGMNKYSVLLQTKYDYTTMRIGKLSSAPTFSVINEEFGYKQGVLGGYINTLSLQIKEAVGYACRIFRGEDIKKLPILKSQKEHVLDWEEMKRWNISPQSIPDNYKIINMPFQERHPTFTTIVVSVFTILIITIILNLTFLYIREARRRKEANLNLWKEKEILSLALEDSNIFAWRYDSENNLFNFDKDFFEKLKMESQTISLNQISNAILPIDRQNVLDAFSKVRNKEEERRSVQCRCNFNGQGHIWYEYRFINTIDSLGKSSAIIGLIINIQEYKDKEEVLIEAKNLAAKAELKQSFLANMSHEIRTPLNAIVGFSNLLVNNKDLSEEDQLEFITIINKNCDLLLKLINDILEISRIESGNMTFQFEQCELASLIEDIYATHSLMMPEGVTLQKNIPPIQPVIQTDLTRLNQVITNFINNAIKFTTEGYIAIGCQILPEEDVLQIYVKDTGKGIPAEEQKMIFERFYKQDEFAQGTGLGLSISQIIVEKLGGKIQLESEENKGSCFTISFPYSKVKAKDIPITQKTSCSLTEKKDPSSERSDSAVRATILIAEDTESNYMLLKTLLGKHFELLRAINGKEAVEITKQRHIDLILMDIKMPDMNGIDALIEIRKDFSDLPIIMQTAYAFEHDKENAIIAGCSGFLSKPIVKSELQKIINHYFPEANL